MFKKYSQTDTFSTAEYGFHTLRLNASDFSVQSQYSMKE